MAKLGNGVTAKTDLLIAKVDFLLDVIAKGAWPRFILAVVGFIVVSFIFSVFFGIWVGSNADNDKQSFVLLSKAADDDRKKVLEKQQRDWLMFALSVIASIVTGVVANILFTRYFGQL